MTDTKTAERERIFQSELRLTAWLREFGDQKTQAFQDDMRVALEEMERRRAELDPTPVDADWMATVMGSREDEYARWWINGGIIELWPDGNFDRRYEAKSRGTVRTLLRLM